MWKPSSIIRIRPKHKILVPSIIYIWLTDCVTSADSVSQFRHQIVTYNEGLSLRLLWPEHMDAAQMIPVGSGGGVAPDEGVSPLQSVDSDADLGIKSGS